MGVISYTFGYTMYYAAHVLAGICLKCYTQCGLQIKPKKKETNHTQRFQSNIRRAKANDCKRIVHIYTCTLLRVYKYMVYTLAYIIRNMYALKW